jgi:integrase-like protein
MGLSAHLCPDATFNAIAKLFWWPDMRAAINDFVTHCLHCLRVKGKLIPRPFGNVIHFFFFLMWFGIFVPGAWCPYPRKGRKQAPDAKLNRKAYQPSLTAPQSGRHHW